MFLLPGSCVLIWKSFKEKFYPFSGFLNHENGDLILITVINYAMVVILFQFVLLAMLHSDPFISLPFFSFVVRGSLHLSCASVWLLESMA